MLDRILKQHGDVFTKNGVCVCLHLV